jgi:AbrB family looped-hinge helix DNA binding protein
MPTATVSSKGQITIPAEVRESLRLKAGDKIEFFEDQDGRFSFVPKSGSIMDMEGILKHLEPPALGHISSILEMDEAVLEAVSEDYLRSVGEGAVATGHPKAS